MSTVHYMKRGDTAPAIGATLTRRDLQGNRAPIDLNGCTVSIILRKFAAPEPLFKRAVVIVEPLSGRVRYDWQVGDTAEAGTFRGEFEVVFSATGTVQTHANTNEFRVKIREDLG